MASQSRTLDHSSMSMSPTVVSRRTRPYVGRAISTNGCPSSVRADSRSAHGPHSHVRCATTQVPLPLNTYSDIYSDYITSNEMFIYTFCCKTEERHQAPVLLNQNHGGELGLHWSAYSRAENDVRSHSQHATRSESPSITT